MVELHLPVMEKETLHYLDCRSDGIYVDATVGDGGHAEAICRRLGTGGLLVGLDWDEAALERSAERLVGYGEQVKLFHADYTGLESVLDQEGIFLVNGILVDLGASTLQLLNADRGFSFHRSGDLDMRMDRRLPVTAKEIINTYNDQELAEIFYEYGEERWSRRIAARIVQEREQAGFITDSARLAEVVKDAIPARYRRSGRHPARRVFQALRLAVNRELDNLEQVLPRAVKRLVPGGRLCIISYHSLEDRRVKKFFREQAGQCNCPPDKPCVCDRKAELKILTSKAIKPSEEEIAANPRARSARLRAAERLVNQGKKEGE